MKKTLILSLVLGLLLGATAYAQITAIPKIVTVSQLSSFTVTQDGLPVLVIDGATETDCTVGSGTENVWCTWDGTSAWVATDADTPEVNDLSSVVTWANVPDANITESSVTQHEAALTVTESQVSDLAHTTDTDTTLSTCGAGYVCRGNSGDTDLEVSQIFSDGTGVGIDTGSPNFALDVAMKDGTYLPAINVIGSPWASALDRATIGYNLDTGFTQGFVMGAGLTASGENFFLYDSYDGATRWVVDSEGDFCLGGASSCAEDLTVAGSAAISGLVNCNTIDSNAAGKLSCGTDADTQLTQEQVQDYIGTMVTGNTETGISVTYDDAGNEFDFVAEVTQAELDAKSAATSTLYRIPRFSNTSGDLEDTNMYLLGTGSAADLYIPDDAVADNFNFSSYPAVPGSPVDACVAGFGASYPLGPCTSTEKEKYRIRHSKIGLDEILSLRPREFKWRGSGRKDLGFVAEEAIKVSPLLVTEVYGKVQMNRNGLIAALVNAIQEQQKQIDFLLRQHVKSQVTGEELRHGKDDR